MFNFKLLPVWMWAMKVNSSQYLLQVIVTLGRDVLFFDNRFLSLCMYLLCLYVCALEHSDHVGQKRCQIPWNKLTSSCELSDVATGNWTQVLCKNNKHSLTAEPFSRTWGNIFNISLMLCSHDLILCFSDAEQSWASFLGFHFFFHLLSSCNAFQGFCSFLLGYIFYYINTDNTFYNMNKKLYTKKCFSKPGTFQLLKRIFQHASLGPLAMGK